MSKPRLIDVHTHVNFNAFKEDSDAVIRRTLDVGTWIILVGSQMDTSERAVEFANKYPAGVYAAVGLHPIHLTEGYWDKSEIGAPEGVSGFSSKKESFDYDAYRAFAQNSKVVAIGECGLDYYRVEANLDITRPSGRVMSVRELQSEIFRKQIQLAREVQKPLMVHCRPSVLGRASPQNGAGRSFQLSSDAYEDCLRILQEEKANEVGGDIHFFAGSWATAQKFLDFGFHLSFTGVLTLTHDYDEVIKNMPLDRVMIETDAPYVAPVAYRGKRNEPLYVAEVARRIAEIRGISFEEVAEATTQNAIRLFHLK